MWALPRSAMGCLWFVIVVFPDHTNLLFFTMNVFPVRHVIILSMRRFFPSLSCQTLSLTFYVAFPLSSVCKVLNSTHDC